MEICCLPFGFPLPMALVSDQSNEDCIPKHSWAWNTCGKCTCHIEKMLEAPMWSLIDILTKEQSSFHKAKSFIQGVVFSLGFPTFYYLSDKETTIVSGLLVVVILKLATWCSTLLRTDLHLMVLVCDWCSVRGVWEQKQRLLSPSEPSVPFRQKGPTKSRPWIGRAEATDATHAITKHSGRRQHGQNVGSGTRTWRLREGRRRNRRPPAAGGQEGGRSGGGQRTSQISPRLRSTLYFS